MMDDSVLQRGAFEILHDDKGAAILLADIVNGADVRVIQRRRGSSLAAKATQRVRVASQFVRQELHRDNPMEPLVLRLVHDAHPARADLLENAVMGRGPADQRVHAVRRCLVLAASEVERRHFDRGPVQETSSLSLEMHKRAELPLQRLVVRTDLMEKRVAVLGRALQHRLEQAIELLPAFRVHYLFAGSARGITRFWRCSSHA